MADGFRRLARHVVMLPVVAALAAGCGEPATDSDNQPAPPSRVTPAPGDGGGFAAIAAANGAAVVNISTTRKAEATGSEIPEQLRGTPFEEFFERFFGGDPGQPHKTHSLGSGFIVASDGYVVTNAHVVAQATEIVVRLSDRRQLTAEVVGKDKVTDLALLRVHARDLPTVTWAEGQEVRVGEWVVAMGAPFGFENSVTAGIVSAKGRSLPGDPGSYVPFLQTDVAINPGNSGGPLFDLDGRVVGVNAQIYSRSGGYMGLSFAIPANIAREVIAELKATGKVSHGWMGVAIQEVNRELAASLDLDKPRGGIVTQVVAESPAAKAGVRTGDVIVAVDGEPVAEASDIPPLVGRKKPGSVVRLTLIRDGERIEREVTLAALGEHS